MLLWSVDILKKKDPVTGQEIQPPWFEYTPYVIVRPKWFPLDVQARSQTRIAMLKGLGSLVDVKEKTASIKFDEKEVVPEVIPFVTADEVAL